jgi:glycosyltransferase involved in cell wall biosynthesis
VKVLFDAHMLGERESGNETYAANLLRALAREAPDADILIAAAHPAAAREALELPARWRLIPVSGSPPRRLAWDLPRAARREAADLLHVTYCAPPAAPCPVVDTIHDLSFLWNPAWFSPRDRLVLRAGVGFTARRAAAVITVSEFCRRDIQARLGIPPERIVVTPEAAGRAGDPAARTDDAAVVRALGVRPPYLLAVGNLQPRKNLARLVEAYAAVRARDRLPHQLVVAGKAAWRESEIYAAVGRHALERDVLFPGYVAEGTLAALYRQADLFVFPSLFEGFGLPVLEAMACGTPVVCADRTSLPEVAGEAARLVDPEDAAALSEAIRQVLGDAALRAAMRARGLERARRFTWQRTARETLAVYRRVCRATVPQA